jgi:hypothetical protein
MISETAVVPWPARSTSASERRACRPEAAVWIAAACRLLRADWQVRLPAMWMWTNTLSPCAPAGSRYRPRYLGARRTGACLARRAGRDREPRRLRRCADLVGGWSVGGEVRARAPCDSRPVRGGVTRRPHRRVSRRTARGQRHPGTPPCADSHRTRSGHVESGRTTRDRPLPCRRPPRCSAEPER